MDTTSVPGWPRLATASAAWTRRPARHRCASPLQRTYLCPDLLRTHAERRSPSRMEPSSPSFRARPASRADAAAQTERLTSVRQKLDHQKLDQPSRGQRTRRTVDLSPATHRALDIWQREAADRLGFARVTGQEVISALIELLLTDPKLSAEVTRSIRDRR